MNGNVVPFSKLIWIRYHMHKLTIRLDKSLCSSVYNLANVQTMFSCLIRWNEVYMVNINRSSNIVFLLACPTCRLTQVWFIHYFRSMAHSLFSFSCSENEDSYIVAIVVPLH
uniref:Uncharacterized protein n=1 Tax=Arundo donax TaxID=35708 RepID=A0A0A9DW36_ARUDO